MSGSRLMRDAAKRAVAGGLLIGIAAMSTPVLPAPRDPKLDALGQEIVRIVRESFYNPKTAEAWAKAHDHYGASAENRNEFNRKTRDALAELKASHTAYYTPDDSRYYGLLSIFKGTLKAGPGEVESIGADFTEEGFTRVVFPGGPAAKAGLLRGDKVLSADGAPFQPVTSLKGKAGRSVSLKIERSTGSTPQEIRVTPRKIDPGKEWLEAQQKGARLIERDGAIVAYVPLFSCAGEQYMEALQDALGDNLREAGALVVDFRDGWGGCNPDFVNVFNDQVPALTNIGRDGEERRYDPSWRKPLFILINDGTRSGKEVVSYALQQHHRATLVGTRTAGAVLAGKPFLLSDKSLLYLAIADFLVDDKRLEGIGVSPDVEILSPLPYAAGADPQLDKALDLARIPCSGDERTTRSPAAPASTGIPSAAGRSSPPCAARGRGCPTFP
ncbi:MAG TPA: S41 family peptidase [Candidatus Polarisedimenticolia bacterium]|nr:S41 family peptidase [Candidatus Polarisedimenticolia bacterium]